MKLGHSFEIVIESDDLDSAAAFYRQLGWRDLVAPVARSGLRLSDGFLVYSLERGTPGVTRLRYFTPSIQGLFDTLARKDIHATEMAAFDGQPRKRLVDPNGLQIEIVEDAENRKYSAAREPTSKLGHFGELSIETEDDVKTSFAFWTALGFEPTQYNPNPVTSWASVSDGLLNLGIYRKGHVKHMFRGAVITYFNEDAAKRIDALKNEGIRFSQELEHSSDKKEAVLEAPDKQMLFLFGY